MKEKKTNKFLGITLALSLLLTCIFGIATVFSAPNINKLSDFSNFGDSIFWTFGTSNFDAAYDFEEDYKSIHTVEISNSIASVEIVPSKNETTHVSYQGSQAINVRQDRDRLEIDGQINRMKKFKFGINNESGKLIVELGTDVDFLKIESGVGTHFIRGISLDSLDIDDGIGTTTVKDITLKNDLEIEGGVGNIDVSEVTAKNVEVNGGVGNIKLSDIKAKSIDLENGIGNITIKDSQTDNLYTSKGLGQLSIENVDTKHPIIEEND